MKRKEFIEEFIGKHNCSFAKAKYAWTMLQQGKDYKPRVYSDRNASRFIKLGISIEPSDNLIGYRVFQNGKERPIYPSANKRFKHGSKFSYFTWIMNEDNKQVQVALAVLVMLLIIGEDIPAGYAVDHIDNDTFNNDPSNLQLLTIGDNVKKDHPGNNQFTSIKDLRHTSKYPKNHYNRLTN